MADYAKKRLYQERVKLSKDPWQFSPPWSFPEGEDLKSRNLKAAWAAGRKLAEEQAAYNASLEDYKPEVRERLKREHYENVIAPRYAEFQSKIIAPARAEARQAAELAEYEALQVPESRFGVAVAMKSLDRVNERMQSKKRLSLPELEQLPPATLRAIAATGHDVSGLSPEYHRAIKAKVLGEEGGVRLAEAQERLKAVELAAEALDYGQAVAESELGINPVAPEVERSREARAEAEERVAEAAN